MPCAGSRPQLFERRIKVSVRSPSAIDAAERATSSSRACLFCLWDKESN